MWQIILILILIWGILAYHRLSLTAMMLSAGLLMLVVAFKGVLPWWQWLTLSACLTAILALSGTPRWRMKYLSEPLRRWLADSLPAMSATEQEALAAGQTGWEKTFFTGKPDWNTLLERQPQALSEREYAFINGPLSELCELLHDWEINHQRHDLPPEAWQKMREIGLFGMIIPPSFGGLGFSARAHSAVIARLASRNVSAAVTAMVPNSLGPAELLLRYGTKTQQQQLLPKLASGEHIPCFALTAADAGSDAAAMLDEGVVECNDDGEIGIRLNWHKRYITLAPVATLLGLAFRLRDPDGLLGEDTEPGITLALIPVDTPGVTTGRRHWPMGLAFMNGPTDGKDVWITPDQIIGGPSRAGQGWRMLMECLSNGRGISLPAMAVGAAQKSAFCCGAYALVRKQFHLPIGRFEGVEMVLASIGGHAYMMNAAREFAVQNMDAGETSTVASAILKYHLTERMRLCVNAAMDIHGGKGISQGPRNYLGDMYQALPVGITVEGANILTRSLIIFGQGVLRCHPCLLTEMESARSQADDAPQQFDRALCAHISMLLTNAVRSIWLGLTHARFTHVPVAGPEACYYQHASRFSAALALCADVTLLSLGSAFKRREAISARLGDAFSQLYMLAATLRYFRSRGSRKQELPLLQWACEDALWRTQQALDGVLRNLPHRPLAWLLRRMIFPWGLCYQPPADWLDHQVAAAMMTPELNQRITEHVWLPEADDEPLQQLRVAWQACLKAAPLERRLELAIARDQLPATLLHQPAVLASEAVTQTIFTDEEAELWLHANTLRQQVIAVDDFAAAFFTAPPKP